ncbi:MAG: class I SAM-dependent methyltransferase [Candidatus Hodarchaeota archaeon]
MVQKKRCSRIKEIRMSRVLRSKEKAKASYNRMSRWYDLIARLEKKYREAGLEKLRAKEGETILEVGFGTGQSVVALAQSVGSSGMIYGIDISEGMYDITKSKISKEGLSERVRLTCGDAVKLPFKANFFDAIFISFTLELFDTPEIPTVLSECKRVLRKGGRICIVSMSKKREEGIMARLYEWAHRRFPNYLDCRPIFVKEFVEGAGFGTFDVTEMSMWGLPVAIAIARKT